MSEFEPLIRLAAALLAGLALGIERDLRGHPAGTRTHVLVSVGAAVFTLAGAYGFADLERQPEWDPARVAAQVASGIGFIGAGAILRHGASVKGLTTAATLWLAASLGVLAGAGSYGILAAATALVLFTLLVLPRVRPSRWARRRAVRFRITCLPNGGALPAVIRVLSASGAEIRTIEITERRKPERTRLTIDAALASMTRVATIVARLTDDPDVLTVKTKQAHPVPRVARRTPRSAV